jgi:hypothetical protein
VQVALSATTVENPCLRMECPISTAAVMEPPLLSRYTTAPCCCASAISKKLGDVIAAHALHKLAGDPDESGISGRSLRGHEDLGGMCGVAEQQCNRNQ